MPFITQSYIAADYLDTLAEWVVLMQRDNAGQQSASAQAAPLSADAAKPKLSHGRFGLYIGIVVGGLLFFSLTAPQTAPPVLLIVGFVVMAAMLFAVVRLLLVVSGIDQRLSSGRREAIVAVAVCFPVLLLALQSIGQLTVRDCLTLGGLFALGIFYVSRMRRHR